MRYVIWFAVISNAHLGEKSLLTRVNHVNYHFMSYKDVKDNNVPQQLNLSLDEFLDQAGVPLEVLNEQASRPQPKVLSLGDYHALVLKLNKAYPSFSFDSKQVRIRQVKRGSIPGHIQRAAANIRAWQRELDALATCEAADKAVQAAVAELRLLDRLGTNGARAVEESNPFARKRRRVKEDILDEEPHSDDDAVSRSSMNSSASMQSLKRRWENL
jgi:hypothetical protein